MVVVTVIYPKTAESKFDLTYYLEKHTPLVRERFHDLGLQDLRLMRGSMTLDGGVPAFEVIAQLVFDSTQQLQAALARHGAEIMADIPTFTNVQPLIQINETI